MKKILVFCFLLTMIPTAHAAIVFYDSANRTSGISGSSKSKSIKKREVVASPEADKATFDRAFQSLKELKYTDAAGQFLSFLSQYPNSKYADNAQYWLGESYFVARNYGLALEAFKDLVENYSDSPKVPDAWLKIYYIYSELKQWEQARGALIQVKQQYPNTRLF